MTETATTDLSPEKAAAEAELDAIQNDVLADLEGKEPNDTETVEIDVEEPPAKDEPEAEKPAKAAPNAEDEGIEQLRAKLEAADRAKADADKRREQAEQFIAKQQHDLSRHQAQIADGKLNQVAGAIDTLTQTQANLERALADAIQTADGTEQAKLHREIARNEFRLESLEQGKAQLEHQKRVAVEQARRAPVQQVDPLEQWCAAATPRTATWLRAHPEFARDPALRSKASQADYNATRAGLKADTAEYFDFVEGELGIAKAAAKEASAPAPKPKPTVRAATVAAPVSRSAGGAVSARPATQTTITLSRAERETARELDMSDKEYATYKAKLIAGGQIGAPAHR